MFGSELNYTMTKTTIFFNKLNKAISICGLPNLWVVDVYNSRIYRIFRGVMTLLIVFFVTMEIASFFTQPNLSDKQSTDRMLFCFSHPILFSYYICLKYQSVKLKQLFIMVCISLKKVFNDPEVEKHMIKKVSYYTTAYIMTISSSLFSYGFDGLMQFIRSDGSFTTVVTAWPDVNDNSTLGNLGCLMNYLLWWTFMLRVSAPLVLTIATTVVLSHQYKNLQCYFYSLNAIFDDDGKGNAENDHEEKELKYLEALKVGIKLHSDTMWCTRQCQTIYSLVFSGQIIINVSVVCLLMLQMVNSERTLTNALAIVATTIALLTSTGFLMWNAGDVTVEAAIVPSAMFSSGWQNCRGKMSKKIRNLLVVAMMLGQKHVVLRGFGFLEISYQSYLSIVKSSYSAFSILY